MIKLTRHDSVYWKLRTGGISDVLLTREQCANLYDDLCNIVYNDKDSNPADRHTWDSIMNYDMMSEDGS